MTLSSEERELTGRLVDYNFYSPMDFFRNWMGSGFLAALVEDWSLTRMRNSKEARDLLKKYKAERKANSLRKTYDSCYLDSLILQEDAIRQQRRKL